MLVTPKATIATVNHDTHRRRRNVYSNYVSKQYITKLQRCGLSFGVESVLKAKRASSRRQASQLGARICCVGWRCRDRLCLPGRRRAVGQA